MMKGLEGWERESSDSAVAAPAAELLGNEITFPSSLCSALLSSRLVSHAFRSSSSSLQLLFSPLRSPGKNIYKKKGKREKEKPSSLCSFSTLSSHSCCCCCRLYWQPRYTLPPHHFFLLLFIIDSNLLLLLLLLLGAPMEWFLIPSDSSRQKVHRREPNPPQNFFFCASFHTHSTDLWSRNSNDVGKSPRESENTGLSARGIIESEYLFLNVTQR